jgi:hypothetical protein
MASNDGAHVNLASILERLLEAKVDFILVGGLAAVAQGVPLATFDVDIVHRRSEENIQALLKVILSLDGRYRRPDDKILHPKADDLRSSGHILLATDLGPLDVLGAIEHGWGFDELLEGSVEIEFRGFMMRVLSLATLLELKRDAKEAKDVKSRAIIEETLKKRER